MVQDHPPLVSFVIPCYNQGHYLNDSISTAFAQTGVEVEVIVVDDGSTDSTREVMGRHPGIRIIHQANQGLAAARNAGARIASGDFLCWLDADDRIAPDFSQSLIARCLEQDCDFAFCDFDRIDETGRVTGTKSYGFDWPVGRNLTDLLMRGGLFPPVCALGRRDAFPRFPSGMDGHADYAVWLDVSLQGRRFAHVPRPLAHYREYANSMSRDRQHMELSAQAALAYNAQKHPERFFEALQGLQRTCLMVSELNRQRPSLRKRICQILHLPPLRTILKTQFKRPSSSKHNTTTT